MRTRKGEVGIQLDNYDIKTMPFKSDKISRDVDIQDYEIEELRAEKLQLGNGCSFRRPSLYPTELRARISLQLRNFGIIYFGVGRSQ
jgi:hypothetical protein